MKVAIVCDWLVGTGGAERVVLELHRLYPEAPIYTSQYDPRVKQWFGDQWFEEADIRTLWTQRLPKFLRKFLPPLRAWVFSRLDLSDYDLVISSSGAEAKFVRTTPKPKIRERVMHLVGARGANEERKGDVQEATLTAHRSSQQSETAESSGRVSGSAGKQARTVHISYCHAPTHYYWARYEEYLANPGFGWFNPIARLGLKLLVRPMRHLDLKAAARPDYFIANSNYTKEQIKKYYNREAEVIHPPVDIERFTDYNQPADKRFGYVTAGRQAPYKRINLAVAAATKLDLPLLVIGRGPDRRKLKKSAGRNVTFLRETTDEKLAEHFGAAKGFIFPGIDDFGIVAVEAMAAGTPVLAYGQGGALDYINKTTGRLFDRPSADALSQALDEFSQLNFDHQAITQAAKQFSAAVFRQKIGKFIAEVVK